jgi:PPOX class probable F420-dependent enzyme
VTTGFAAFDGQKYLNLETFRKSGVGVRTPVWFAAAPAGDGPPTLYVYTTATAGKAKRIRRSGAVRIAPCDSRGRVTGAWMDATAMLVEGPAFQAGMRLIDSKYRPIKQILDLTVLLFRRHQRVVIAIWPAATSPAAG